MLVATVLNVGGHSVFVKYKFDVLSDTTIFRVFIVMITTPVTVA